MMKKNIGKVDMWIRILIALVLGILVIAGVVKGTLAIVFVILALVSLITGVVGFCGLYTLLGFTTCPKKDKS